MDENKNISNLIWPETFDKKGYIFFGQIDHCVLEIKINTPDKTHQNLKMKFSGKHILRQKSCLFSHKEYFEHWLSP